MTTIYGTSDDQVICEGDVCGQVDCYGTSHDDGSPVLLICSDGTLLTVKYGKNKEAIWEVSLLKKGDLFREIQPCLDEDADPYSDQAIFEDGLKWIYAATRWGKVD